MNICQCGEECFGEECPACEEFRRATALTQRLATAEYGVAILDGRLTSAYQDERELTAENNLLAEDLARLAWILWKTTGMSEIEVSIWPKDGVPWMDVRIMEDMRRRSMKVGMFKIPQNRGLTPARHNIGEILGSERTKR